VIGIASAGSDGGLSGVQYREARRRLISMAVSPLLFTLEAHVNHWLAPEYGEVRVRFSPDGLAELTEDELETSGRAISEYQAGVRTLEEARALVALPEERDPTHHVKAGLMGELSVADVGTLALPTAKAALEPPDTTGDATGENTDTPPAARAALPPAHRYDPNQPRDPGGTPTGGRWTAEPSALPSGKMPVAPGQERAYSDALETTDDYTDATKAAINRYTGGGYTRVNQMLLEGETLTGEPAQIAEGLESGMRSWDRPVTVARGLSIGRIGEGGAGSLWDGEDKLLAAAKSSVEGRFPVGEVVDLGPNYQSSSAVWEPALDASGIKPSSVGMRPTGGAVLLIDNVRRGVPAAPFSQYDDEAEIILPRNTRVRIKSVEVVEVEAYFQSHKRVVVHAEAL
jgi:hypothetical protein